MTYDDGGSGFEQVGLNLYDIKQRNKFENKRWKWNLQRMNKSCLKQLRIRMD